MKNIKFSPFFIGTVLGLFPLLLMIGVIDKLLFYLNWDCDIFIGVAILLLFPILFLGYIGKKINNQLCINLSRFITGFYIFGFLLAILLYFALIITTFAGFWDFLFQ